LAFTARFKEDLIRPGLRVPLTAAADCGFWKQIFPQMTNWPPKDEAAQLCFAFEAELARLIAA
jgi:hypothetical protein